MPNQHQHFYITINVKVDPPVLNLIKVMCNMADKEKRESKAYGLVKTAVE